MTSVTMKFWALKLVLYALGFKQRLVLKLFPFVTCFRRMVRNSGNLHTVQPQNALNDYCSNH